MVCSRYPKEYKYYETILKKKCFKKLRNNVWEKKTKWILIKKADHHYRIKLLYKYINLWVAYLNICYKKKFNRRAAEAFHEEKLKAKSISVLKKNVEQTWMLLRICKKKFEWDLKYKCWHQWKHYVQKRLKVKEIKVLGDKIREERLRIRIFYLWLFRWNEKRSFREAYETAVGTYAKKLKEKCFKYWKTFTSNKICQMQIMDLAVTCYRDKLKEKYIRCWKRYTFQKRRYRFQVTIIQNFYENFIIKNYLSHWFAAYKRFKHEKTVFKNNLALNFYCKKVLEKSFKMLWKAREMKKVREEAFEKFRNIYVKIYLNLWAGRRTEKIIWNILQNKATKWREDYLTEAFLTELLQKYQERVEEKEKMENVIKYCDAITIYRAFWGWCEVMKRKIDKKIRSENVARLYVERLTNKAFEKWKKYVRRKLRKKMTTVYYRHKLLSRILYLWKISLTETKLRLEKARNLERQHIEKLLKNVFEYWREETKISKLKLNAAINFCNDSRISKAFYIWKKNVQVIIIHKSRYNRNKTIFDNIIIKNTIYRLCETYSVKQNVKKILQKFKFTQEKRSLGSYFNTWHNYVEKMKSLQQNTNLYSHLKSNVLIEQYLTIVLEKMSGKKVFNKKNELARTTEKKLLKRRYLRKWQSFICWKKESMLRCRSKERSFGFNETLEIFVPVGKSIRRRPMIPGYLKAAFSFDQFQELVSELRGKNKVPTKSVMKCQGHLIHLKNGGKCRMTGCKNLTSYLGGACTKTTCGKCTQKNVKLCKKCA